MKSGGLEVIQFIRHLDSWSNQTIKNSFIGKLISNLFLGKGKPCHYIDTILLISISVLLVSLSLPQFASDRFGIGMLIMACFGVFVVNLVFNKNISPNFNSIDLLLILFLCISLISTFSSYYLKESSIGLLKYIAFCLVYLIIKIVFYNSSYKTLLNILTILCICALVISLIGIYQFIIGVEPLATWEDPNVENIHTRVYSTLGNPNLLAGYLLLILPLGFVLPFELKSNFTGKIFFLFSFSIIFTCLIFTGSRGGYLGLIVQVISCLTMFLNRSICKNSINQITTKIVFIGFVFFIAILFLFPHVTERLLTIFTLREHSSNNYRVNVWLSCLEMLKDNFLIGIGPGNSTFRLVYGLYMKSSFEALATYNIFLEIAAEIGIMGLLVFIFIFVISFLKLHYLFWEKSSILALGIFISFGGILTHGMVDTVFFRPQVIIPFFLLLASIDKLGSRGLNLGELEKQMKG